MYDQSLYICCKLEQIVPTKTYLCVRLESVCMCCKLERFLPTKTYLCVRRRRGTEAGVGWGLEGERERGEAGGGGEGAVGV